VAEIKMEISEVTLERVELRRRDYNAEQPHSPLGDAILEELAAREEVRKAPPSLNPEAINNGLAYPKSY
jgi:hypothetical protein